MMIAVQEACARIGTCKAKGLGYIIAYYYIKNSLILRYCYYVLPMLSI